MCGNPVRAHSEIGQRLNNGLPSEDTRIPRRFGVFIHQQRPLGIRIEEVERDQQKHHKGYRDEMDGVPSGRGGTTGRQGTHIQVQQRTYGKYQPREDSEQLRGLQQPLGVVQDIFEVQKGQNDQEHGEDDMG